ncbi:MAG: hypothetical protein HPY83_17120 [Anaerolineae bacterium]|nr:hypothetical protein [Anaerolineae bacterium]
MEVPSLECANTILDLPALVDGLSAEQRDRFDRLFRVSSVTGQMRVPAAMRPWVEQRFGSVAGVEAQRIVKVTNLVTLEGALFNEIRSCRPFEVCESATIEQIIAESEGDPFCHPLTGTPEDPFGRVRGQHCITASNVAKYDGFHGLVIFDEHDPLRWSEAEIADYLRTALTWAERARELDPSSVYFFLMWNCLWKSGASIVHGHAQMTLSQDIHYANVEWWRRCSQQYRADHGTDLFDDLWKAHRDLGLGWEDAGVRGLAHLTPIKEKEVLLLGPALDEAMAGAVYRVLECMVERMGVRSFNVAFYVPPLAETAEDWSGFPVMARLVDRGDLTNRVADFGAMELYASSVVASDPFAVASCLGQAVRQADLAGS